MSDEIKTEGVDLPDLSETDGAEPKTPQEQSTAPEPEATPAPSQPIAEDAAPASEVIAENDDEPSQVVAELEAVLDVPVGVAAVLGRTNVEVSNLLALNEGDVIELDRKVGEAIDIFINNRLIARGEVVLVEDRLGVTMTEIIKGEQAA